jgi:hypothetical protein
MASSLHGAGSSLVRGTLMDHYMPGSLHSCGPVANGSMPVGLLVSICGCPLLKPAAFCHLESFLQEELVPPYMHTFKPESDSR